MTLVPVSHLIREGYDGESIDMNKIRSDKVYWQVADARRRASE